MSEIIKEFKKGDLLHIDKDGKAYWGFPDGYPYKSEEAILDGTFEFADINGRYRHQITDENFTIVDGKSYTVIWDGEAYQCVATIFSNVLALGNLALFGVPDADTGEPFLFIYLGNGQKMIGTNSTSATHTVTVRVETPTSFSPDFLPIATTTTSGIVKQIKNVNNATGAAPTAEEFNALLKSLRDAGILATS